MKITNKKTAIDYFQKGKFGNNVKIWNSLDELFSSNYTGSVTIRYKSFGGGPRRFNVHVDQVKNIVDEYIQEGWKSNLFFFNEDISNALYNCEIIDLPGGLCVGYVDIQLGKHVISRELKYLHGLSAKMFLKKYLYPVCYDNLICLLDYYPNHVIEISVCDCCVGQLIHQNTIFWEVRYY